jgi:stage II sporulation SpoE-like protein
MIYALFDPASGKLSFSNAGLPYPLLVSKSGCRALGQGGVPAGLLPDSSYERCSVHLSPGDAVLFATDGLHELRDRDDRDFSWDRLSEIWQQCRSKSADESLDFLFEEAKRFSEGGLQKDDITAVVLKVHPAAAGAALGFRRASSFERKPIALEGGAREPQSPAPLRAHRESRRLGPVEPYLAVVKG